MRVDGTAYFPTFASHVLCGAPKPIGAAAPVDCAEWGALKSRFVTLLPKAAAVLWAPKAKGRLRLVCKSAPYDEAQRG
jgi:hypothetical protein